MHNQNDELIKKMTPQKAEQLLPKDKKSIITLKQRAELLKAVVAKQQDVNDIVSYIKFKLGKNDLFGIPFSIAQEVIRGTMITPVPFVPDYISGVINHRGLLLTVINLKKYLKITDDDNQHAGKEIIIINSDNIRLGLQVRYIEGSDIYQLSKLDTLLTNAVVIKPEYITGIDKGNVAILNIKPVLSDVEHQLKNMMLRR